MDSTSAINRFWEVQEESAVGRSISRSLPIAVVLLVWELISGTVVPTEILPPVVAVLNEFINLFASGTIIYHTTDTLFRGIVGILFAMLIGIPLGLLMARNETVYENLDPLISLTYPVPKSALIPLLMVWLGTGHVSRIILAVIGSLLPMLINTYNGATNVNENLLWASKSMGVNGHEATLKVVFPSALPNIMTGIRIGAIFSFVIVISSEMIIAQTGLGVIVSQAGQFGRYATVFALILWITILVAGFDRLYLVLSNRILSWSEEEVSAV